NGHCTLVGLITALITEGDITVLVGTKALLGEGWDAPVINTLILASTIGAFMLTNQMRGRAIRTVPGDAEKTANIWHLVTVDPLQSDGGTDFIAMQRRFHTFMGANVYAGRIENGISRIGLGDPPFNDEIVADINDTTMKRACDRGALRDIWMKAVAGDGYLRKEVTVKPPSLPRKFVLGHIAILLIIAIFQIITYEVVVNFAPPLLILFIQNPAEAVMAFTGIVRVLLVLFMITLVLFLKSIWAMINHSTAERSMYRVAKALLNSLQKAEIITTPPNSLSIEMREEKVHNITYWTICSLKGGTPREASIFSDAMADIFNAIANPRYLVRCKSWWFIIRQDDFYPVPTILGAKKENAEEFMRQWQAWVTPAELIYTRTPAGRASLLIARGRSISNDAARETGTLTSWQ
ncbi:MAG: hypothetical protein WCJ56_04915, partial [bacterium]